MGRRENQGQDNNQGWEKEKASGLVKNKGGNSITSPNNNPGVSIRQLRVTETLHKSDCEHTFETHVRSR